MLHMHVYGMSVYVLFTFLFILTHSFTLAQVPFLFKQLWCTAHAPHIHVDHFGILRLSWA